MTISYIHLSVENPPPILADRSPFKALLVIEQGCTLGWQSIISRWLVDSGCLYAMAWGIDCSSWDDAIDLVNLEAFNFRVIPEEAFVITTWHSGHLKDAINFAAHLAHHPSVRLNRTVIVHISPSERRTELVRSFQKAIDV